MHELQVTESIVNIVFMHANAKANRVTKVLTVHLKIGELSDLENDWIQHYFDYLSKGTIAEGAKLKIERIPVVIQCNVCSHSFEVNIKEMKEIECEDCGSKKCQLISGKEYYIKSMEVL